MASDLKKTAIHSTFWSAIQRFGTVGISFISNIVLARLLGPEVFGAIGLLHVFIAISIAILDGGFTAALIQRKDIQQKDFSTAFIWNIVVSLILIVILYIAAPYIASYYNTPILSNVLRVQGIILFVNSLFTVQVAKLTKEFKFKILATSNLIASLIGVCVGISMAYLGFGIWSLVVQEIVRCSSQCVIVWRLSKWRPSFEFSWESFKGMFKFGLFMFLSSIIDTLYENVQSLIIGRRFSISELGYYTQAKKLETIPVSTASSVVGSVLFPTFSTISDDLIRLKYVTRKNLSLITFVSFPMMLLLAIIGGNIIIILYGAKWGDSIPMFQILCIGGMFHMLNVGNTIIFKSLGDGKTYFYLQTIKRIICIIIIAISSIYGIYALLWCTALTQILMYCINMRYTKKAINYTYTEQLSDIIPNLVVTIATGAIIILLNLSNVSESNIICITLTLVAFVAIYFILSYTFKLKSVKLIKTIWDTVKS